MGINPGLLMALSTLNSVDTKDYDNVLKNFQTTANNMSGNPNLGNWTWSVDGSDDARRRAETAVFQSYMDRTKPIYQQQTDDLQTRLANQGLTPGSEAYQRAMTDLQNNQNNATNQAAYAATLAGQNAFSQSLNDSLSAGNFANNAQGNYINQIWNLLQNSMSGYDKNMQMANLVSADYNQQQQAKQAKKNATNQMIGNGLNLAATIAGGLLAGPAGAALAGTLSNGVTSSGGISRSGGW